MKTFSKKSLVVAALLSAAGIAGLMLVHAQETATSQVPDSIVQVIADEQGLQLLSPDQIPGCGTFWIVTDEQQPAPLPFLPSKYDLAVTPVYSLVNSGDQFLVDATGGAVPQPTARQAQRGVTSATLIQAQMDTVLNLITQVETAETSRQMQAMGLDVPMPGVGGGTNSDGVGGGGSSFQAQVFTTNDLWLQIITVTNNTASLVIHPPWNATNSVYYFIARAWHRRLPGNGCSEAIQDRRI